MLPVSLLIVNDIIVTIFLIYHLLIKAPSSPYFIIINPRRRPIGSTVLDLSIMQLNLGVLWSFQYLAYKYDDLVMFHHIFTTTTGLQGIIMLGVHLFKVWQRKKSQNITYIYSMEHTNRRDH